VDWVDLGRALVQLGDGSTIRIPDGDYVVIGGTVGLPPTVASGEDTPFRRTTVLDDVAARIRMDSWVRADTIRRMGFGHVIVGRRHTLIVERGVSFVAFDAAGTPLRTAYAANIFAPQARYLIQR
jgi:hypothetical protein